METLEPIERLLRWRSAALAEEAPPAPSAARLLENARPWWECWPEKFQAIATELAAIRVGYGHAMTEPVGRTPGRPVPTVVMAKGGEQAALARVVYLKVHDHRLRLRFSLEPSQMPADAAAEVTLIAVGEARALLRVSAIPTLDDEFRVDAPLPPELATAWASLKVNDPMPFRFVLRFEP